MNCLFNKLFSLKAHKVKYFIGTNQRNNINCALVTLTKHIYSHKM